MRPEDIKPDFEDDEMDEYVTEPDPEVLDDWEKDEMVAEIVKNFQDPELAGQSVMKFRDVYKLLEVLGMRKEDFVAMFMEVDLDEMGDDYDENGEYRGEDEDDFEFDDGNDLDDDYAALRERRGRS